jgi:hypothetical protein
MPRSTHGLSVRYVRISHMRILPSWLVYVWVSRPVPPSVACAKSRAMQNPRNPKINHPIRGESSSPAHFLPVVIPWRRLSFFILLPALEWSVRSAVTLPNGTFSGDRPSTMLKSSPLASSFLICLSKEHESQSRAGSGRDESESETSMSFRAGSSSRRREVSRGTPDRAIPASSLLGRRRNGGSGRDVAWDRRLYSLYGLNGLNGLNSS